MKKVQKRTVATGHGRSVRMVPRTRVIEHFLHLYTKGSDRTAYFELAWSDESGKPSHARLFSVRDTAEAAEFAARINAAGHNVYVGGALRRPTASRNRRGSQRDVLQATAVWADFDNDGDLRRARKRLRNLGTAPSLVCITGTVPHTRGQIWFALDKPLKCRATIERLNKGIQATLGGDSVSDVARVMRLPGTIAWPFKPGRVPERTFISSKGAKSRSHNQKRLERIMCSPKAFPPSEDQELPQPLSRWAESALRDEADKVTRSTKGERNVCLHRAAFKLGQLIASGDLPRDLVERTLREAGASAGLDENEIRRTVNKGIEAGKVKRRKQTSPPSGYVAKASGLYRKRDGKHEWLCSPIHVVALIRDESHQQWGRLVELVDPDGIVHTLALPASAIGNDAADVRRTLNDRGFILSSKTGAGQALSAFLMRADPVRRARVVNSLGWTDDACSSFVLANGHVIGDEDVVYQPQSAVSIAKEMRAGGSLEGWRRGVARPCIGNPLLIVAVSAAFAGSLLDLLGAESFGGHFRGESSKGKTTLLRTAASVWGSPKFMQTWRATGNALEGLAAATNGTALCLDEIGQINGQEAGQIIYTIANGVSKARANALGEARPRFTWSVVIISSGEVAFADVLEDSGKAKAGQQIRLLDIPADRQERGVFDDLHSSKSGAKFSKEIKRATRENFGTAGPAFVGSLIGRKAEAKAEFRRCQLVLRERLAKKYPQLSGQADRGIDHFSVIAAAGELATSMGITGWSKNAALDAALVAARLWIRARGGSGATERQQAIQRTRSYLSQHGSARFERPGQPQRVQNRAGWFSHAHYYILEDAWLYMHKTNDAKRAAQYLREAGFLLPDGDGRHMKRKAPTKGSPRCYCISARILGASGTGM